MFAALAGASDAVFSSRHSRLLLSPSLQGLRDCLADLQEDLTEATSFTLFFAGHGGLAHGSYYLAVADTKFNRMSTSAFGLSHLFEFVNESAVGHCNIIIDACNAGGMVSDIGALLKPEIIGKARSAGVSIFVSAASDQYAGEIADGGFGTSALLRVIGGEVDTGSRARYLDLLDVGRTAAQTVIHESGGSQSPSIWGINLYGAAAICPNPHASFGESSILSTTGISPNSQAGQLIAEAFPKVWQLVSAAPEAVSAEGIFDSLHRQIRKLAELPDAVPRFVEGVRHSLLNSPAGKAHSFAPVEITGTCMALILDSVVQENGISQLCYRMAEDLVQQVSKALAETLDAVAESSGLCTKGIPDLFLLPQRIARVLGWGGAAQIIAASLDIDASPLTAQLETVEQKLIDEYGGHFCGMSELEAPFWMVYLLAKHRHGDVEQAERVVGMLWHALLDSHGAFARTGLEPEEAFEYLRLRAAKDERLKTLCANPSESLAMTMLMASRFGLDDVLDQDMVDLDHAHAVVFVPADHTTFAQKVIRQGRNHVFQIGYGVWTLQDLCDRWEKVCLPQFQSDASLTRLDVQMGALCSALVFPDRVPWFLFSLQIENR
ncbi:caspase family protein [Cupriavidus alkaliphilus]|uniref:caspase family protein n=1 Tax=Cupriavidus alkaliphilus TaxID=942866 RepID=UPI00339DA2E6